jgi:hypothetical protein
MSQYPPALPHGELTELFPNVFFVTGAMETELMDAHWQFSRNMTVVRDGDSLTLINSVRLDERGLAQLDSLGQVKHIVRLGALHGRDDAFYRQRYEALLWALPKLSGETAADHELAETSALPIADASLFVFRTSKLPEAVLLLDRAGGIVVACDALQNWPEPDEYFSEESRHRMAAMGFFQSANFGPVWMLHGEPQAEDFDRLLQLPFSHALCGHGRPLLNSAKTAFAERRRHAFAD